MRALRLEEERESALALRLEESEASEALGEEDGSRTTGQHSARNEEARSSVVKRIFGIGPCDGTVEASQLVHPHSNFHVSWISLTACFLLYTAIVTPAVISFHWLDGECEIVPTLPFDCVLDTFFLVDILYSMCCVGVYVQGQYIDDPRMTARAYLTGSFAFDLLTSVPVSYVELMAANACVGVDAADPADGGGVDRGSAVDSQQLRFIRAMKPLRWFKLARVMKLKSSTMMIAHLCDRIAINPVREWEDKALGY